MPKGKGRPYTKKQKEMGGALAIADAGSKQDMRENGIGASPKQMRERERRRSPSILSTQVTPGEWKTTSLE